jgi:hypothetical protein
LTILKQKDKVLGKRQGCSDMLMDDEEHSEKKMREAGPAMQRNEVVGETVDDEEATSHGAAGTLTGAKEHTCQEP